MIFFVIFYVKWRWQKRTKTAVYRYKILRWYPSTAYTCNALEVMGLIVMIYVTDVLIYFASLLTYACFLTLFVPAYLLISLSASASPYKRLWLNRVAWTTTPSRTATGRTTFSMMWTGTPDRAVTRTHLPPHPALPPPRSYTRKPCPGNPKSGTEAVYQSNFFHY